jgi:hypothetical protein
VGAPCPECDGPLVLDYADERARIRCTDCGGFRNEFAFPRGTLHQFDRAALPAAADRWPRSTFERVVAGFCPNCGGRVDSRLVADYPTAVGTAGRDRPRRDGRPGRRGRTDRCGSRSGSRVVYDCRRCGAGSNAPPFVVVLGGERLLVTVGPDGGVEAGGRSCNRGRASRSPTDRRPIGDRDRPPRRGEEPLPPRTRTRVRQT